MAELADVALLTLRSSAGGSRTDDDEHELELGSSSGVGGDVTSVVGTTWLRSAEGELAVWLPRLDMPSEPRRDADDDVVWDKLVDRLRGSNLDVNALASVCCGTAGTAGRSSVSLFS